MNHSVSVDPRLSLQMQHLRGTSRAASPTYPGGRTARRCAKMACPGTPGICPGPKNACMAGVMVKPGATQHGLVEAVIMHLGNFVLQKVKTGAPAAPGMSPAGCCPGCICFAEWCTLQKQPVRILDDQIFKHYQIPSNQKRLACRSKLLKQN